MLLASCRRYLGLGGGLGTECAPSVIRARGKGAWQVVVYARHRSAHREGARDAANRSRIEESRAAAVPAAPLAHGVAAIMTRTDVAGPGEREGYRPMMPRFDRCVPNR